MYTPSALSRKHPFSKGRPFIGRAENLSVFTMNLSAFFTSFHPLESWHFAQRAFPLSCDESVAPSPPVTRCLCTIPVLTPQHRSTLSSQLARRPTSEAAALPRRAFYGGKIDVIWIKGVPSPAQTRWMGTKCALCEGNIHSEDDFVMCFCAGRPGFCRADCNTVLFKRLYHKIKLSTLFFVLWIEAGRQKNATLKALTVLFIARLSGMYSFSVAGCHATLLWWTLCLCFIFMA